MTDLALLETKIAALVSTFRRQPFAYFSERELHGEFFGLCRNEFGDAVPNGQNFAVPLFRCEYNTLWRYRRADAFSTRWSKKGRDTGPGSLDFAILRPQFVQDSGLLTVINKHEPLRTSLRADNEPSRAVDTGIEFKMAHIREAETLTDRAHRDLATGLVADARKLAHEWPSTSYLIGFSHGPDFSASDDIMNAAFTAFARIRPQGDLRLMLAAREAVYQKGAWGQSRRD